MTCFLSGIPDILGNIFLLQWRINNNRSRERYFKEPKEVEIES